LINEVIRFCKKTMTDACTTPAGQKGAVPSGLNYDWLDDLRQSYWFYEAQELCIAPDR